MYVNEQHWSMVGPFMAFGDSIRFNQRVLDKIERGFYYPRHKRKHDFDGIRRLAPSKYHEELRRLRIV